MRYACQPPNGGSAPATLGFNAVAPEWLSYGAADAPPAVPAAESTLRSHPCVALSFAQVLPEWINHNLADNALASNGDNPLNFVSHSRGSLHRLPLSPLSASFLRCRGWLQEKGLSMRDNERTQFHFLRDSRFPARRAAYERSMAAKKIRCQAGPSLPSLKWKILRPTPGTS
jgi:hypothetical protein